MTHDPVMLREVLALAAPRPGEAVLDCTLGLGGHASALLSAVLPGGSLIGLDADRINLREAKKRLDLLQPCECIHASFGTLPASLPATERTFDILLADLGLSSPHVDDASRGFSFRYDAPLDMRFDRERGLMAAHYLQSTDQATLLNVLKTYGEFPRPHALLRSLVERRSNGRMTRTTDLADAVRDVYGRDAPRYLPQVFQAIRIAVNREMESLDHLLAALPLLLRPGGRAILISYHSLEDRRVKDAFRLLSSPTVDPVTGMEVAPPRAELLTRKPQVPSREDIERNPRARSAKLRAIRMRDRYTTHRSS